MSARRDEEKKNQFPAKAVVAVIIMLIGAMGIGAIPLLIIGGIGYAVYGALKKQSEESGASMGETLRSRGAGFIEKLNQMDESGERPSLSDMYQALGRERSGKAVAASRTDNSARDHMNSKFDSARRRQRDSAGDTLYSMLSRSEQRHVESLASDFHDEYLHRSNELKDLLNAGIIEMPEYRERMVMLKAELRR